ncbi:uncharacterized protein TM35_000581300, partial [Trypanosoma theileri]
DLCRQRTARTTTETTRARTTTTTTVNAGQPKAVMKHFGSAAAAKSSSNIGLRVVTAGNGDYFPYDRDPTEEVYWCMGNNDETNPKKYCASWRQISLTEEDAAKAKIIKPSPPQPQELQDNLQSRTEPDPLSAPASDLNIEPHRPSDKPELQATLSGSSTTMRSSGDTVQSHSSSSSTSDSDSRSDPMVTNSVTTSSTVVNKEKSGPKTKEHTTKDSLVVADNVTSDTNTETASTPPNVSTSRNNPSPSGVTATDGSQENGNSDSTTTATTTTTTTTTTTLPPATAVSEGNGDASAATTTNTNTTTEAPITTTPSRVPNAEINTIPPNMQMKGNTDSSVSPVWMRTAAPLLIVTVLVSATVY